MVTPRSGFLSAFCERGYVHQCTDLAALDAALCDGPVTAYIGFDCTAPSLHVGSLLQIMALRLLQRTGHKPIVLMGGGTTKVGDPSGKEHARPLLDDAAIAANMAGIRKVIDQFLRFGEGPTDAVMVDNAEWLDRLAYIPFLREVGRHFSVNRMLSMESVKLRLEREQPLSFLEFNYMVLQAYDFLELERRYGCTVQLGGSDQWGNIVNGVELARRVDDRALFGLTTPLITTAAGDKMGKSAHGAVWLSADALAPYDYWQFWRNVDDADVGRFLRLFTELPLAEIAALEALSGAALNEAKKRLATEATALCHGAAAAAAAEATARHTFEEGAAGAELPTIAIPRAELSAGVAAFELLHRTGLTASRGESRRLIKGGGLRINGAVVASELHRVTLADLGQDGFVKISAGRKRHALVRTD
ncbi:MAG: tyrosine--tRNA ligase [Alphaproteobacteria bacterium]|nr:tyrosine--tRNA ligase [Alphaproteobacteria bacterium]